MCVLRVRGRERAIMRTCTLVRARCGCGAILFAIAPRRRSRVRRRRCHARCKHNPVKKGQTTRTRVIYARNTCASTARVRPHTHACSQRGACSVYQRRGRASSVGSCVVVVVVGSSLSVRCARLECRLRVLLCVCMRRTKADLAFLARVARRPACRTYAAGLLLLLLY